MKPLARSNDREMHPLIVIAAIILSCFLLDGCGAGTKGANPGNPTNQSGTIRVSPATSTVSTNGTDVFTAAQSAIIVSGGQWVVLGGTGNGTIDPNGTYHSPASVPSPAVVSVGYVLAGETYVNTVTVVGVNTSNTVPIVTSVAPSVISSIKSSIQVAGSGFTPTALITVNSIPVTTTYVNSTNLAATVLLQAPISATLQIAVINALPASVISNSIPLAAVFPTISVLPAQLAGGPLSLSITGSDFAAGDVVFVAGVPLATTVVSSSQITATGYLTPWTVGSVAIEVAAGDGSSPIAEQIVPVAPTPVTYDSAARFADQASFGPRPDVVQHIQQVGFEAFIKEQFAQAPIAFVPLLSAQTKFLHSAVTGNSLLRQRVAYALESFIVPHDQDFEPSQYVIEETLEADADANFRKLLDDVASDPNIGDFLNLTNNYASTDPLVHPNQNFARELMQLFSLGPVLLNDDGSEQLDSLGNSIPTYSQDTVIDLTRAFTGWLTPIEVNASTTMWGTDFSQPLAPAEWAHDHGAKLLFGAVQLPAGQSTTRDREMALDAIFNHPNLPPYISHVLIQQLVKSNPSPAYIQRISNIFENDGTGVRGNMSAVVSGILLDAEARAGDSVPSPTDGALQSPLRFELFAMSALQTVGTDDQPPNVAGELGENWWSAPTVFGFFSPSYKVPGTTVPSPEFQLFNNLSLVQRSEILWGIVTGSIGGFTNAYESGSWLFNTFKTVPAMVDALNHLLYHGQMSSAEQSIIINYCNQLNPFDTQLQMESAVFLALNADSYNVAQ